MRPGYQIIWGIFALWFIFWFWALGSALDAVGLSLYPFFFALKMMWMLSRHPRP